MKILDSSDIGSIDNRSKRRLYLKEDWICVKCGVIFNTYYQKNCTTCNETCKCGGNNFVTGKLSVDLRLILDFNIIDLKSLNEIYGFRSGSRIKMVNNIIQSMHPNLDKNINERLIKKMLYRNRKNFAFLRDIDAAMNSITERRKLIKDNKSNIKLNFINSNDIID